MMGLVGGAPVPPEADPMAAAGAAPPADLMALLAGGGPPMAEDPLMEDVAEEETGPPDMDTVIADFREVIDIMRPLTEGAVPESVSDVATKVLSAAQGFLTKQESSQPQNLPA